MKIKAKGLRTLQIPQNWNDRQTGTWFVRMFYAMAAVPVVLLLEALVQNSSVAAAASAVIMLSIMAAVVSYGWAMFKSYHFCVFCSENSYQGTSAGRLVLSKMVSASAWLLALCAVITAVFFLHGALLERMAEVGAETELSQWGAQFVRDNFGEGIILCFSGLSLFLQAVVLINITYIAATAAHLKFFERYKTLAGIFIFVLLYVFENDFATIFKRMIMRGFGGIEGLSSQSAQSVMGVITGIETIVYLTITAVNVVVVCYFLKKVKKGKVEWKK